MIGINKAGIPPRNINGLAYQGAALSLLPVISLSRNPTTSDNQFPLNTFAINVDENDADYGSLWYLSYFDAQVSAESNAIWIRLSDGNSGPLVKVAVPLGTSPVHSDSDGLMTFTSAGGTIDITGTTNAINFDLSGDPFVDLHGPKFIVGDLSNGANYSTIADAITDASSGDTVYIQARALPYTENLTLKSGVNLTAFTCDALTPNVTIIGKLSYSQSGTVSISGIRLQTNSDFILEVSGSSASVVNLTNCYLNLTNNSGISYSSSSANSAITLSQCTCDTITTGIAYFSDSSVGTLKILYSEFLNSGNSSTSNTKSNGQLSIKFSTFRIPIIYSSSDVLSTFHQNSFNTSSTNSTFLTTSGTGTVTIIHSSISSGTASTISIGSGTTVSINNSRINSTNTNAITGSGTIAYGCNVFTNTSSTVNTTTQTVRREGPSRTVGGANSGGTNQLAVLNSSDTASSDAKFLIQQGGTSGGDAYTHLQLTGTNSWTYGMDISDSGYFVISPNATLGTSNVFRTTFNGASSFYSTSGTFPTLSSTAISPSLNTVNTALRTYMSATGGGSAAGFGNAFELFADNASNVQQLVASFRGIYTVTTAASETSYAQVTVNSLGSTVNSLAFLPQGLAIGTNLGIQVTSGTGSPHTVVTAPQGSLYLRTDGTTTNDRAYINTNGTTGWTAIITAT